MTATRSVNARSRWLLVLVLALLAAISNACGTTEASAPLAPVEISIYSSSTKEDWVNGVTESFNEQAFRTSSGTPIEVQVFHVNSGGSLADIISGEIQPTVWSPGDMSWARKGNEEWLAIAGRPLIPEECLPLLSVPTGFVMWRPMAEAMGWPDEPIYWKDFLELASDPQGWGRYQHPEWGRFKLGLTDPSTSNSGLLIMSTLPNAVLDEAEALTLEQVQSEPVIEAFRELGLHTAVVDAQSARLLERMVTGGPDRLHVINSNEGEALKSTARYAKLLPYPLVFVIPAEGTIWAEHPYCILDETWVTDEQREAARLFGAYLLELEQQTLAMEKGLRPANASVELRTPFTLENGVDPRITPLQIAALDSPALRVEEAILELFEQANR